MHAKASSLSSAARAHWLRNGICSVQAAFPP